MVEPSSWSFPQNQGGTISDDIQSDFEEQDSIRAKAERAKQEEYVIDIAERLLWCAWNGNRGAINTRVVSWGTVKKVGKSMRASIRFHAKFDLPMTAHVRKAFRAE